jgi:hypothetical protein
MLNSQDKSAWWVLLLVVFASGAGLLMGTALGAGIASLFYEDDGSFLENMGNPTDDRLRVPLLVVQGMTTLCGFLIAPYFMWITIRKKDIASFNTSNLAHRTASRILHRYCFCRGRLCDHRMERKYSVPRLPKLF